MTREETQAFCDRIRAANADAVIAQEKQREDWLKKFPSKPFPPYLKKNIKNRFESYLKKLEREAGII
jgi:hypothetical protein